MGMKKYNSAVALFVFALFVALTLWCCSVDDAEGSLYCYNCITTEPDTAEMVIKLTINEQNPAVQLTIYQGEFNTSGQNEVLRIDTITVSNYTIYMHTNKTYSVTATYQSGNRKIMAVDGGVFNRQEQTGCETTCWQLIGGSYDVQLKEY